MKLLSSSPTQLLRPSLGFRVLPRRRTSIASSSPRFLRMESQSHPRQSISSASSPPGDNGFPAITTSSPIESARIGEVKRETKETKVSVKINLDGNGVSDSSTGIPFLDHMLNVTICFKFLICLCHWQELFNISKSNYL